MAGIYIHIPFCKQACYYCNFHFSTSLSARERMVNALIREIEIKSARLDPDLPQMPHEAIETIYFGGGTPSLLLHQHISSLLQTIRWAYHVEENAECTLEANPDDITPASLSAWKQAGINRLSIGVQSFFERDLAWMNRVHTASQAAESIEWAWQAGFSNFSVDLIFGTPGLGNDEWRENIRQLADRKVPHISAYALTVEPRTALKKMIALHKKESPDHDMQAAQYLILMEELARAGYEHYEISSFALPGFRSRHNSSYWHHKNYTGIGPSAHSYNGTERYWNVANNAAYLKSLEQDKIPFEKEQLTAAQRQEEYIMTSLRTIEGMDLRFIGDHFSAEERNRLQYLLEKKINPEWFDIKNECVVLTRQGKLFADHIAVALFR